MGRFGRQSRGTAARGRSVVVGTGQGHTEMCQGSSAFNQAGGSIHFATTGGVQRWLIAYGRRIASQVANRVRYEPIDDIVGGA